MPRLAHVRRAAAALITVVVAMPLALSVTSPASAEAALTVTPTGPIGPVAVGDAATASFTIDPNPAGEPVHLEWTVRAGMLETDLVARSGSADATPDGDGVVSLTFETPSELGEGTYGLEVVASDDVPGTGSATGSSGIVPVVVDNPSAVSVTSSLSVFYPVRDGFRDSTDLTVVTSEDTSVVLSVETATGVVKRTFDAWDVSADVPRVQTWAGMDDSAQRLAAGLYTVRARATDAAGNLSEGTAQVEVSHARVRTVTSTVKYKPKTTMYDKFVGRCSKLRVPSTRGWAGSHGYYSQARCKRTARNADVVIGMHAWWVPQSVDGRYGDVKVRVYGGKAKKQRWAYLVLGYYRTSDNAFIGRRQLTPRLGWHDGRRVDAKRVLRFSASGRPFINWSTGLAQGSKYDVKQFQIKIQRRVLVAPGGTIVQPPPAREPARSTTQAPRAPSGPVAPEGPASRPMVAPDASAAF